METFCSRQLLCSHKMCRVRKRTLEGHSETTSTIANFMPLCTLMILFIKVLLNVSCCRKDQKCYITCYISPKCGLYFYFFGTAIGPEKVYIVIDNTTFPIFINSQTLQEASNNWCALPVILLNEPSHTC